MLTAGVLTYDGQGRVRTTLQPPTEFNGGTPTRNGLLCIAQAGAITAFGAGLGYVASGAIRVVAGGGPGVNPLGNDLGQVRVGVGPAAFWYAGLPFTAAGRVAVAPPV